MIKCLVQNYFLLCFYRHIIFQRCQSQSQNIAMNRIQTNEDLHYVQMKQTRNRKQDELKHNQFGNEMQMQTQKKQGYTVFQHKNTTDYTKVDILFFNTFEKQKSLVFNEGVYHAVKALIFIIFIPLDYSLNTGAKAGIITVAMAIALAVSLFAMFGDILYYCIPLQNTKTMLKISKKLHHNTQQPLHTNNISAQKMQNCVSQRMYNQPNQTLVNQQGFTQQLKDLYENILLSQLQQMIYEQYGWLKSVFAFAKFICFGSFVFSLIAVCIGEPNVPERVVLIVYIALEGATKIVIILIIILVVLSPIICCGLCFFVICCGSNSNQIIGKMPPVVKATSKDITQAGGDCTICYQSFKVSQDVIKLKCSDKHMFHQFCIGNWVKIKPNCPVCRQPLSNQL